MEGLRFQLGLCGLLGVALLFPICHVCLSYMLRVYAARGIAVRMLQACVWPLPRIFVYARDPWGSPFELLCIIRMSRGPRACKSQGLFLKASSFWLFLSQICITRVLLW